MLSHTLRVRINKTEGSDRQAEKRGEKPAEFAVKLIKQGLKALLILCKGIL